MATKVRRWVLALHGLGAIPPPDEAAAGKNGRNAPTDWGVDAERGRAELFETAGTPFDNTQGES